MALTPGSRLGAYEILTLIGVGGMGEVYRATDTKLHRDVAIKVLPSEVAADPDRLARFEREAQVLASLNHPNIAHIHGVDESAGVSALIMELVEGPTLADRITKGPIPLDEALPIAKQIAEALEAAHEQGIIHRDLKPANIKVRSDGTVKVLDFGLAKAFDPITTSPGLATLSPTLSIHATQAGIVLGTAAYMAPEQVRGSPVDKRADIWAFGVVLYEMLVGRQLFEGVTISDTLASVLRESIDIDALASSTPERLRRVLRRCLERDPKQRLRDIGDARLDLGELVGGALDTATTEQSAGTSHRLTKRRVRALVAVTAAASAALAGGTVWLANRPVPPRVVRTAITPTGGAALTLIANDWDLTITPDGSRVVYVGNNGTQLFVRALDTLEPTVIVTGGALRCPFVSPDGQWVGFVDNALTLKKVAITGGPVIDVARLDAGSRGATWLPDDSIVFATANTSTGLQRVSANGGTPVVLTKPDHAHGEVGHLWPEQLPGGRAVLFTIPAQTGADSASIAVLDLQTGAKQIVMRGGSHAQYVASGHLVYAAAGTLRAVPFDLTQRTVQGTAVPVVPHVVVKAVAAADFAIAGDGTLVYADASGAGTLGRTLVWVDRGGKETPLGAPVRNYSYPSLSPDGTRIAVSSADEEQDIWMWDVRHGPPLTRLTLDPASDLAPIWTPDGRRIIFGSDRVGGVRNLWWQAADGTGTPERLTTSANTETPTGITRDGRDVLITEVTPTLGFDLVRLPLQGDRRPLFLVQTKSLERNGVVSPDGNWLAYESDISSAPEVYVRPYPHVEAGARQVSLAGGTKPLWSRSGTELFYASSDGALMRVPVEATATVWNNGAPVKLFDMRADNAGAGFRTYDVTPDGQQFLLVRAAGADKVGSSPTLILIQHFEQELKRHVPAR